MKAVLDSSVLIAAAISRAGVCAELLEDVLTHHELVLSEYIVDEVREKLIEKFGFPDKEVRQLARLLLRVATITEPATIPPGACRDADNLPVLGTAVAASADLLVSVDKDLLSLNEFMGIAIIRPGDFWKRTTG
ncbi:MAG: putative toxin-antitoxin system toxin component, PIN family [Gammaproteobacteria bacterium]|nr:putative toxin-antitoxin system toxin component, PIN family [Gammaproteobacteria bacterium]